MPHTTLNQGLRRIEVSDLQIENELVFAYFDSLPSDERDAQFVRAIQIGVLALKQDRLAAFLAKTKNELGTELESLKMIFDMQAEVFAKSTVKGAIAEVEISDHLTEFAKAEEWADTFQLTGNAAGSMPKNKTGDILCFVDGDPDKKIVIECKFDKNVRLGKIENQDWYGKRLDTALGQLVEAQANRDCQHSIIVFDRSSINAALQKEVSNISYRPQFGFIVVVDSMRGDYSNLSLAYMLTRDLMEKSGDQDIDLGFLQILLDRIISDAGRLVEVRNLVENNIKQSREIIVRLEQGRLSLDFCRSYLRKFVRDHTLSPADLHQFYTGGDSRERYFTIEQEIKALCEGEPLPQS